MHEWPKSDSSRCRAIAYALTRIVPILPPENFEDLKRVFSPRLAKELAKTERRLKAEDVKVRRDAMAWLSRLSEFVEAVELREGNGFRNRFPDLFGQGKNTEPFVQERAHIERITERARFDNDLQVRRQARKLQGSGIEPFDGFMPDAADRFRPGRFGPDGFGPGFSPRRLRRLEAAA